MEQELNNKAKQKRRRADLMAVDLNSLEPTIVPRDYLAYFSLNIVDSVCPEPSSVMVISFPSLR